MVVVVKGTWLYIPTNWLRLETRYKHVAVSRLFTQFYRVLPSPSASRAAMQTSLYPTIRTHWAADQRQKGGKDIITQHWAADQRQKGGKDIITQHWAADQRQKGGKDIITQHWAADQRQKGGKDIITQHWAADQRQKGGKDIITQHWAADQRQKGGRRISSHSTGQQITDRKVEKDIITQHWAADHRQKGGEGYHHTALGSRSATERGERISSHSTGQQISDRKGGEDIITQHWAADHRQKGGEGYHHTALGSRSATERGERISSHSTGQQISDRKGGK
ncbi:hypothetical protein RRG08_025703 [Elysia crispata]|uniref:Uncharacterized protein n=1 Tax=Elysia crispata TaxID=231223 RepID=A0AAE1AXE6_9GAST|nr:hypothetical protein RRG08_025703 [Elysia crispata]